MLFPGGLYRFFMDSLYKLYGACHPMRSASGTEYRRKSEIPDYESQPSENCENLRHNRFDYYVLQYFPTGSFRPDFGAEPELSRRFIGSPRAPCRIFE